MKASASKMTFDVFNYLILFIFCLTIILPFMHIISISISSRDAIIRLSVGLLPKGTNFSAYTEIMQGFTFRRSLFNTVFITAIVTFLSLIVDISAAYAMSKKFCGKTVVNYYFVITMYFSGGLIPYYLLITKYLHWYNNYLALTIPGLVNVFYIIVLRSQIESIPGSLVEAGIIDGANERQVLFDIVIPSITASIAAIGMFIALGTWNSWFNVMIFTNDKNMWTLQYYLRAVIYDKTVGSQNSESIQQLANSLQKVTPENFQNAAIILVALPVVAVYPFVQKYFVKGILVGSVKE